jgi:hypothetical protein
MARFAKTEWLRQQEQGEESDAINLHLVLHPQLHPAVLVKVAMRTGLEDTEHRHGAAGGAVVESGATPAFGGLCRHKALTSLLPSLWGVAPDSTAFRTAHRDSVLSVEEI